MRVAPLRNTDALFPELWVRLDYDHILEVVTQDPSSKQSSNTQVPIQYSGSYQCKIVNTHLPPATTALPGNLPSVRGLPNCFKSSSTVVQRIARRYRIVPKSFQIKGVAAQDAHNHGLLKIDIALEAGSPSLRTGQTTDNVLLIRELSKRLAPSRER
jgi:hypothetical protein